MFRSSSNLGFPRKVVAYYLLFCMVAVSWLACGILLTSHTVLGSRAADSCLSRVGKLAAAIEIEYLRHGPQNLQATLLRTERPSDLIACSIASPEGTFLAHSVAELVGQPVEEPTGEQLRWGNVTELQYVDSQGRSVREYRVPLVAKEEHFGTLRMSIYDVSLWVTLGEVARVAPLALLVPLALVGAGAVALRRLASPLADLDSQLRAVARQRATNDVQLQPLKANDATAIGWNRIVDTLESKPNQATGNNLPDRLADAITARRQNQMQEVLQNLTDGIAVTDVEGRITFANRAVAALIGADTGEGDLNSLELEDYLRQNRDDDQSCPLFDPGSAHRPVVSELPRSNGSSQRVLRVARSPLAGETPRGHVWSVRDVTQQKLTEKMRDQFIDVATHELRTPLSNIKAYAETLATSQAIEIEQQREFCNIINSEVTRLARFVDDLLSISSMEAGSISVERQNTDAARMFEEVVGKVKPLMKQKEIDFEVQLPEKMGAFKLDKDKIIAVFVNLLGNAAKYTPVGGRVSMRVKLDGAHLQIAVEDTGVGIAAEELPQVFDKFFRSADARVQAETGTGLGLSLAREVVRMHGGDITVESQIDHGSTFITTIPVQ